MDTINMYVTELFDTPPDSKSDEVIHVDIINNWMQNINSNYFSIEELQ